MSGQTPGQAGRYDGIALEPDAAHPDEFQLRFSTMPGMSVVVGELRQKDLERLAWVISGATRDTQGAIAAAAPGEDEQVYDSFAAWMRARGNSLDARTDYGSNDMLEAFEAGRAAAPAGQPAPEPDCAPGCTAHATCREGQDAESAPELAAAMAETRQLREALHDLACLWDASNETDNRSAARTKSPLVRQLLETVKAAGERP